MSPLAWYEGRQVEEADFDSAYGARRITEDALDFIDEQYDRPRREWDRDARDRGRDRVRRRRPFLAVLSHLAPHQPYRVEPRFVGRSDGGLYGDAVEAIDHYLGTADPSLDPDRRERPHTGDLHQRQRPAL